MSTHDPEEQKARQLIADILEERSDELDKAACDRCQDCGQMFMCSFHSVLSALEGNVWTYGAIERDRLRRQLTEVTARTAWQPIATAPKDGTRIIVGRVGGAVREAKYDQGYWHSADLDDPRLSYVMTPTHWMPMPGAPTADGGTP